MSGTVAVPGGEGVAPLNFIYACGVCCYSFADVYEGHNETVKGFSDGINPKDRLVTRLNLASCCHVFCSSHLEGGGPAFHSGTQRPKAPCPVCIREKGDSEPRELYSIRGFEKSEYDPMIPPSWFTTPPVSFEGSDKGTEALRFQYLALTRYCQNTHATRKPLQDALTQAHQKLASVQDLASREHAKVLTLQQENERLKSTEDICQELRKELERLKGFEQEVEQYRRLDVNPKDLDTFKTNKEAIRHYLRLVPMLIDQNEKMKNRLASLGFAMALEPIPNFAGLTPNELEQDIEPNGYSGTSLRKTASSHTAGRSAHTSGNPMTAPSSPFMQRPAKRQRVDSPLPGNAHVDPPTSRDAMPPPKKPLSRMRSVRKIFPTLRKKFNVGRSAPTQESHYSNGEDAEMYEDDQWDDPAQSSMGPDQVSALQDHRHGTSFISGALAVDRSSRMPESRGSQLLAGIGIDNEKPDFTFRASSPVKTSQREGNHQPVQLPTEPSYIRLMDGLSRDHGMELGLRDPREDQHAQQPMHVRQQINLYELNGSRNEDMGSQEDWRAGRPSNQHSTNGLCLSAGTHANAPAFVRTERTYHGPLQDRSLNPITPAPRRPQPSHQFESVVSPNMENGGHIVSRLFNHSIAESQGSSNRSVVYRSPRALMEDTGTRLREPRGLNGLSFFDSPVISSGQPGSYSHQRQQIDRPPPSRYSKSLNLSSTGFITRPEAERSPFFRDSAYGSSREKSTPYSSQQHAQLRSVIPFPSMSRSTISRVRQNSSSMPSIISSRSPVRTQPQWQGLQRMGVRSSRHEFSSTAENTYADRNGNIFPSAVRRSVRR